MTACTGKVDSAVGVTLVSVVPDSSFLNISSAFSVLNTLALSALRHVLGKGSYLVVGCGMENG